MELKNTPIGQRPAVVNWEYADETEREAATGFTVEDVGKVAVQLDDDSEWRLKDHDPITWKRIGTSSGSLGIELDYVEITSNVTPTATSEATANTVVTANEITLDGSTEILIEFNSPSCRPDPVTDRQMSLILYASKDGAVAASIGRIGFFATPDSGGAGAPCNVKYRYTPIAGDYVYSIRAFVSAGTGLVLAGAGGIGAEMPAFLRITKANP